MKRCSFKYVLLRYLNADIYDLEKKSDPFNALMLTYFSFTTLSTVGFGDIRPENNVERALWSFILLGGVLIFSFTMETFLEVTRNIKKVLSENESSKRLYRFFGLMKKFNNNQNLKKQQI